MNYLIIALKLAGIGQLILVLASIAIPHCLGWREGLAGLKTLLRQMFWTYAIYITAAHTLFGIISLCATDELLAGTFLSTAICLFMALWWGGRILIQFFYFDITDLPKTKFNQLAKYGLTLLFAFLTTVYTWAVITNLS